MMTSTQVVETSVNVNTNSPSLDYTYRDDDNLLTYKNMSETSKSYPARKVLPSVPRIYVTLITKVNKNPSATLLRKNCTGKIIFTRVVYPQLLSV